MRCSLIGQNCAKWEFPAYARWSIRPFQGWRQALFQLILSNEGELKGVWKWLVSGPASTLQVVNSPQSQFRTLNNPNFDDLDAAYKLALFCVFCAHKVTFYGREVSENWRFDVRYLCWRRRRKIPNNFFANTTCSVGGVIRSETTRFQRPNEQQVWCAITKPFISNSLTAVCSVG